MCNANLCVIYVCKQTPCGQISGIAAVPDQNYDHGYLWFNSIKNATLRSISIILFDVMKIYLIILGHIKPQTWELLNYVMV